MQVSGSAADSGGRSKAREPLGHAVRRYSNTGGKTTIAPAEQQPRWVQLRNRAVRLGDDDLEQLLTALKAERARRGRAT